MRRLKYRIIGKLIIYLIKKYFIGAIFLEDDGYCWKWSKDFEEEIKKPIFLKRRKQ